MKPRVYLYGGSFNPPGLHHEEIVRCASRFLNRYDKLFIVPCGRRSDKKIFEHLEERHRIELCLRAFSSIPRVEFDFTDLKEHTYTNTYDLNERYESLFPNHQISHMIGADLIAGGEQGKSEIQRSWHLGKIIWHLFHFVVFDRTNIAWNFTDLPPHALLVQTNRSGSSTQIRLNIKRNQSISPLVSPSVHLYIEEYQLYRLS